MTKKFFVTGLLGMALMLCPSLAMAEDVAPPVIPATEVEAATPEPVA